MDNLLTSPTLRANLADWTDFDFAAYHGATALGVAPKSEHAWGGKKWMFWSDNPMGRGLYEVLEMLTKCGVLEYDEEEVRYRWNPAFDWNAYN